MLSLQQKSDWLKGYNVVPLPVEPDGKRCLEPGWQDKTLDYRPEFAEDANLGVLLGENSNHLVCADLDWPEAKAAARWLLPETEWATQREYEGVIRLSHCYYRSPGCETLRFNAPSGACGPGEKRRIIDLLSTGTYAIFTGSRHSGSTVAWYRNLPTAAPPEIVADELTRLIKRIAGLSLIVRLWPDLEGLRHEITLALAGSWHHAGWLQEEIVRLATALINVADDLEPGDRKHAVASTLETVQAGEPVTGLPTLSEYLPEDVMQCLVRWWGLGSSGLELTSGGRPLQTPVPVPAADWLELLEFEDSGLSGSSHEYPVDALGPVMAGAVRDLSKVQQAPVAMAAQSVLVAASGAAQALYDVVLDGRRIPLSLWLILVAAAGERKTTTDAKACQQNILRMREALLAWETEHAGWAAALKDKDTEPGPEPRQPNWLLTRGSTEGILKQLERHWPALTFTSADAGSWFKGYSMREGRETATASTLSDLWTDAFQSSALASNSKASNLFNRRLAMSLMLQPNIAAELFSSTLLQGQGFLSRCLPAFPPSTMGSRLYRRDIETPRLQRFYEAVDRLLVQEVPRNLITGELNPADLLLEPAAMELWIAAHDRVETNLGHGGKFADIRDTANKAPEQALRLAGVIAVLEQHPTVTVSDMTNGIALMDFYLQEWLGLMGKLHSHRDEVALPRKLWDWMQKRREDKQETVFSIRDMYRSGPRFIRGESQLTKQLLTELLRRGYVRLQGNGYEMRPEDAA